MPEGIPDETTRVQISAYHLHPVGHLLVQLVLPPEGWTALMALCSPGTPVGSPAVADNAVMVGTELLRCLVAAQAALHAEEDEPWRE